MRGSPTLTPSRLCCCCEHTRSPLHQPIAHGRFLQSPATIPPRLLRYSRISPFKCKLCVVLNSRGEADTTETQMRIRPRNLSSYYIFKRQLASRPQPKMDYRWGIDRARSGLCSEQPVDPLIDRPSQMPKNVTVARIKRPKSNFGKNTKQTPPLDAQ